MIIVTKYRDRSIQAGRSRLATAAAAALGLSPAVPLHAADHMTLEEVIVTSTRRSASVQDVPLNITAVGGSTIGEMRLDDISRLTRWVPGIVTVDQGPWNNNRVITRGLNAADTSSVYGSGDGGTVATYLGETPLFVDFKLLDIDRVEVLLGPQGTLYGAGTLGGAVRYIPNKPNLDEFAGTATVRGYSLAHSDDLGYQGNATVNLPLIDGKLALRAAAGYYRGPGFIDNTLLVRNLGVSNPQPDLNDPAAVAANLRREEDANDERTLAARVSLLYQPLDAFEVLFTHIHQDTESGGRQVTSTPLLGTGPYESAVHVRDVVDRSADLTSLEITAGLGFAELVSSSSWAETEFDFVRDQTDQLLEFRYGYENFPQFVAYAVGEAPNQAIPRQQFVQELRLVSTDGGPFNWIAGGYYSRAKNFNTYSEYTPGLPAFFGIPSPDELEYQAITRSELKEQAFFGELGYYFTDVWQVTVGGRYFSYTADQSSSTELPFFGLPPAVLPPVTVDQHGSLFKFNTSYKFTPDVMMYVTVSEGYRRGGINAPPLCNPSLPPGSVCVTAQEQTYLPDETRNHELGLRSTWFDQRLTANAALYYVKWRDVQVLTTTASGGQQITGNGAKATSQGVELQVQALLPAGFSLMASYAYNDAQLTEDVPGLVLDLTNSGRFDSFGNPIKVTRLNDAFDGDRLPGSPQHTGSLTLQYSRQLANGYGFDASYGIAANSDVITTVGKRGSGETLGGYALHSASVGIGKDRWRATLYADNLFDKYAYTSVTTDVSRVQVVNNFTVRRYEHSVLRPRQIGLELNVSF